MSIARRSGQARPRHANLSIKGDNGPHIHSGIDTSATSLSLTTTVPRKRTNENPSSNFVIAKWDQEVHGSLF